MAGVKRIIDLVGRRRHEVLLTLLVLAVVGPAMYYRAPLYVLQPDILYVKAKVMYVLRGMLFTDPITGYDTMHPPFYHLFLAPFVAVGISVDAVLKWVAIVNVALTFFFTFKVISHEFNSRTAFWTCLLLPFIVEFMGPRNILLSTSYFFSLPFYLAGLWLYLKSEKSVRGSIAAAALWGLTFLISPVFVFLLLLTFVYEVGFKRRYRRAFLMATVMGVILIPFIIQLYIVYSKGSWGATTFAFWRGVPDGEWRRASIVEFISPTKHLIMTFPALLHIGILAAAGIIVIKSRRVHWFVPLSLAAVILSFYHFSGQYAIRVQLFFSLFITASLLSTFEKAKIWKYMLMPAVVLIMFYSLYDHYYRLMYTSKGAAPYRDLQIVGQEFWSNMGDHLEKDSYVFCNNAAYLQYVMPYFPVHTLGGHRKLDYFQLPKHISDELGRDDQLAENSADYAVIDSIARKYNIKAAILTRTEVGVPLYETLVKYWPVVYRDVYFGILRKPE